MAPVGKGILIFQHLAAIEQVVVCVGFGNRECLVTGIQRAPYAAQAFSTLLLTRVQSISGSFVSWTTKYQTSIGALALACNFCSRANGLCNEGLLDCRPHCVLHTVLS